MSNDETDDKETAPFEKKEQSMLPPDNGIALSPEGAGAKTMLSALLWDELERKRAEEQRALALGGNKSPHISEHRKTLVKEEPHAKEKAHVGGAEEKGLHEAHPVEVEKPVLMQASDRLHIEIDGARNHIANRFSRLSDAIDRFVPAAGHMRIPHKVLKWGARSLEYSMATSVGILIAPFDQNKAIQIVDRWKNLPEQIKRQQKLIDRMGRLSQISEIARGEGKAAKTLARFPFVFDARTGSFPLADYAMDRKMSSVLSRLEKDYKSELNALKKPGAKDEVQLAAGEPPAADAATHPEQAKEKLDPAKLEGAPKEHATAEAHVGAKEKPALHMEEHGKLRVGKVVAGTGLLALGAGAAYGAAKARYAPLIEGKQAGSAGAVAVGAGKGAWEVTKSVALGLIPGVASYQEWKAGNHWAAVGWGVFDAASIALMVVPGVGLGMRGIVAARAGAGALEAGASAMRLTRTAEVLAKAVPALDRGVEGLGAAQKAIRGSKVLGAAARVDSKAMLYLGGNLGLSTVDYFKNDPTGKVVWKMAQTKKGWENVQAMLALPGKDVCSKLGLAGSITAQDKEKMSRAVAELTTQFGATYVAENILPSIGSAHRLTPVRASEVASSHSPAGAQEVAANDGQAGAGEKTGSGTGAAGGKKGGHFKARPGSAAPAGAQAQLKVDGAMNLSASGGTYGQGAYGQADASGPGAGPSEEQTIRADGANKPNYRVMSEETAKQTMSAAEKEDLSKRAQKTVSDNLKMQETLDQKNRNRRTQQTTPGMNFGLSGGPPGPTGA